jgi:hypothetical protein
MELFVATVEASAETSTVFNVGNPDAATSGTGESATADAVKASYLGTSSSPHHGQRGASRRSREMVMTASVLVGLR